MDLKTQLFAWIKTTLTARQDFFSGLPPCPYAADALLTQRLSVRELKAQNWKTQLVEALQAFDPEEGAIEILAIENWPAVDPKELVPWVWEIRRKFAHQDKWVLYDHPAITENLGGLTMNFGTHLLFILQSLSELVEGAESLEKRGYYKNWPTEDFEEVVGRRRQIYQELLGAKLATLKP